MFLRFCFSRTREVAILFCVTVMYVLVYLFDMIVIDGVMLKHVFGDSKQETKYRKKVRHLS